MNKLSVITLALFLATAAPMGALAQSATPGTGKAAMTDASEGEVRKIDKDTGKITLKHGPIKSLDMPGMTMVFKVADPALLDKLSAGDKVLFTVEMQQGAMIVTNAEKVVAK